MDSKEQYKVSLSCQELPLSLPTSIQSECQQRVGQALETKVPNPTKGSSDPGCCQCNQQSWIKTSPPTPAPPGYCFIWNAQWTGRSVRHSTESQEDGPGPERLQMLFTNLKLTGGWLWVCTVETRASLNYHTYPANRTWAHTEKN